MLSLVLALSLTATPVPQVRIASAADLAPRTPLDAGPVALPQGLAAEALQHVAVLVKFDDAVRARTNAAGGIEFTGVAPFAAGLSTWLASHADVRFEPVVRTAPAKLEALLERAAVRSGRAQPDLAGLHRIVAPDGTSVDDLVALGNELRALAGVEFATIELQREAPPEDYAPMTPDHSGDQNYTPSDPGLDYEALWSVGADGSGVRFSDCEYGWDGQHEDLVDRGVVFEPGQTISGFVYSNGWDDHGTAVLGINSAPHNGYGVNGAGHQSPPYVYPENTVEEGSRRVTCITNAIADSGIGDVVLLEMQTGQLGAFAPAEVNAGVFMATKVGTDAGVVVVAAAGNGNANLDNANHATWRSWGDSGAIIVGAGTSSMAHNKLSFSSFGSRVDVQAWGHNVFTTGYGSHAAYGGDDRQTYTAGFSGTSSASALTAGACLLVQSYADQLGYPRLSSQGMRALLKVGAIPQGSGGNIGPFPDLDAVRQELECGGANYCEGRPNEAFETGAYVTSTGTPSLSGAGITLGVVDATPGSIGYFILGGTSARVPVSGGLLCIDGGSLGIYRLLPPLNIDSAGTASRMFTYGSSPGSLISPGDVVHYQFWYRDVNGPHGQTANFSDGRAIRFCP